MYIGKADITERNSLRVRCKKYFGEYKSKEGRPKIQRLVKYWGKYLHLKYIELDDNNLIKRLEINLINSILPPFNDYIPDKKTRDAKKAFS
jgi:excinuclease UvrABC nuclease subunit